MIELTDEQIAGMSDAEREELIWRLARPTGEGLSPVRANRRIRRLRLGFLVASAFLMIPWIGFLAVRLPNRYVANNWSATWVGFDVLELAMFSATAVLAWKRRQLLILTAFAAAILLICDAWFDIMTAAPGDLIISLVTALGVELPFAIVLILGALRLIRLGVTRFWCIEPGTRLWQVPILLPGELGEPAGGRGRGSARRPVREASSG